MRFKIIGILLLLGAVYLLVYGYFAAYAVNDPARMAQMYPLSAIFLVLVVRIFQAEKHHRDVMKSAQAEEAEEPEGDEAA